MRHWVETTHLFTSALSNASLLLQDQYSRVPIWVANRVSSTARDGRALAPPLELELALSPHERPRSLQLVGKNLVKS